MPKIHIQTECQTKLNNNINCKEGDSLVWSGLVCANNKGGHMAGGQIKRTAAICLSQPDPPSPISIRIQEANNFTIQMVSLFFAAHA